MNVTTLAAIKGSLPEHDANLEAEFVANRGKRTDNFLADLGVPLVIIGSHDTAVIVNGRPGEPILKVPFLDGA